VRESYIDASEMMDSSQGDTAGVSSLHSSDKHHAGTPYDTMDDIKVPPVMCQTLNMLPPRNVSKPTEIPKPDEKPKAKPKRRTLPLNLLCVILLASRRKLVAVNLRSVQIPRQSSRVRKYGGGSPQ